MSFILKDTSNGNTRECDSRSEAEEKKNDLIALGADPQHLEIKPANGQPDSTPEPIPVNDGDAEIVNPEETLPDQPPMDVDPLSWIPTDFVVDIDGQPAITKKGYDVLAHHYNISVVTECRVSPHETDHTYAEVKATATTDDGIEYAAHGSASTERGDDSHLLLEMADTRAAKRATARATGVGMVAVSELKNDL